MLKQLAFFVIMGVGALSLNAHWFEPQEKETIFLIMRHGEVFGNQALDPETYTYTGCRTNFPLNEKGRVQVEEAANALFCLAKQKGFTVSALYSSPMIRAMETAIPMGKLFNLPIEKRGDLREIDWGIADGELVKDCKIWSERKKEIKNQFPNRQEQWDHLPVFPEAEKFNHVLARVVRELKQIGEKHPGEIVLLVTHGRVLKCLTSYVLNVPDKQIPYPQNAGIAIFRSKPDHSLEFVKILAKE